MFKVCPPPERVIMLNVSTTILLRAYLKSRHDTQYASRKSVQSNPKGMKSLSRTTPTRHRPHWEFLQVTSFLQKKVYSEGCECSATHLLENWCAQDIHPSSLWKIGGCKTSLPTQILAQLPFRALITVMAPGFHVSQVMLTWLSVSSRVRQFFSRTHFFENFLEKFLW